MMRPLPQVSNNVPANINEQEDDIDFRPMTQDDIEVVMNVQNEAHEFPWSEGIMRDCITVGYDCWLMIRDEKVLGFGVMSMNDDECHILNVCSRPSEQRKGYGKRLMMHLLLIGMMQGAKKACLEVRASNTAAMRMYERLSFDRVGERKDYYPAINGREDAVLFELDFSQLGAN